MKKLSISYLLPLLLLWLSACGGGQKGNVVRLKGNIKGLGNDTILLVGMDRLFDRTDTLVVQDDKFSDTLSVDTLVGLFLLFGDGTEYPLYIDRGQRIDIQGAASNLSVLEVSGNAYNDEQTAFQRSADSLGTALPSAVEAKAKEFICQHPASLVSVYLLDKYFVQQPRPDYDLIDTLVEPMTGELKDRPYLSQLLETLGEMKKLDKGRTVPFFQSVDADGNKITRTNFQDQLLLVNVWASWDEASRAANDSLRVLYKRQKRNKNFAMLGISLDVDRGQWLEAVRRDTLEWQQACELKGWQADVAQKWSIRTLPFNVLVNDKGRVLGVNLTIAEVEKELKDFSPDDARSSVKRVKKIR